MKILHVENTASVPYYISKGLKTLGCFTTVVETSRVPENYGADFVFPIEGTRRNKIKAVSNFVKLALDFDIIHFHQGIIPNRADKKFLAKVRPHVIHYHGSETRMGTGMALADKAKYKVVSTPDLLKWHPTAKFIPNPFDASELTPSFPDTDKPLIMHLPTNRALKGTPIVLDAIEELKRMNVPFEFELVEKVSRTEALKRMSRAHIVIDQMNVEDETGIPGLFGMVSLEALSMGKIAISSFDENMRFKYPPANPIISCPPDACTLATCLCELLEDFDRMKNISKQGRPYIEQYHSPIEIAKKHLEIYKEALK